MNGVKLAFGSKGMTMKAVRQCAIDKKEWRALVHMYKIEFLSAIFAWRLCSFRLPSHTLVVYHLERGGMPLHDEVGVNSKGRNY